MPLPLRRSGGSLARGERFLRTPGTGIYLTKPAPAGAEDYHQSPPAPLGRGRWRVPDPGVRKKRSPLAKLLPLLWSGIGRSKCSLTLIGPALISPASELVLVYKFVGMR